MNSTTKIQAAIDGTMRESKTSHLGEALIEVVSAVIKELEEPLFEKHTINEMLFTGYRVAFLDRMMEMAEGFGMDVPDNLPNNTFGLMVGVSCEITRSACSIKHIHDASEQKLLNQSQSV